MHGGGFTGGDKSAIETVRYGEYLASKGYVVASVNYRYATADNGIAIIDMYEDLMNAADVIVEKADDLGYHLNEMATIGGSAGGCLSMLVAFKEPDRLPVPIRFVFEETVPMLLAYGSNDKIVNVKAKYPDTYMQDEPSVPQSG